MSLDQLARWRPLLVELGELVDVLCEAIETAQPIAAFAAMARMRRVRAELSRVEKIGQLAGSAEELAMIREVSALADNARRAETVMERWVSRPLLNDEDLVKTPLGAAAIADAMLPTIWDYDNELVVLAGAGFEPVAEILRDLGQRRIVLVGGGKVDGVIDVQTKDEMIAAIKTMTPCPPERVTLRATTAVGHDEAELLVAAAVTALADLRIFGNTISNFSEIWIQQGAANLPALAKWPSISALDGKFAGKPMVIVAPGPSLATNVHLLASLRGKAILCCFSRSLKPLLAAGITPDLIVTVDPQDLRYHFAGCDLSASCLVNGVTTHPSLFELPARAMLSMSSNGAVDSWMFGRLGDHSELGGGGSVATTAFSLALRWKCDPIIMVGLDLSFPNGNYYVGTSSDGDARAVITDGVMRVEGWSNEFRTMKEHGGPAPARERVIELPGWHGGTVQSGFLLGMFHRWFVDQLKLVTTTRVYNCTEGGAFIDGMIHRRLADVIGELDGSVDPTAAIGQAVAAVDRTERKHQLASHVGDLVRGLRRCRRLAQHAGAVARRNPDQLANVERQLVEALRPLWFASLLAQREITRAHDVARRNGNVAGYLTASIALFDAVATVVDQLEPTLAKALDRLRPPRRVGV